jgi:ubiquinone/menaquinone biosynthesis C-methylase UbiE
MDSTALKKSYFQLLLQHMQRYLRFSAHPTIRYYIIRRIQLVYSLLQEETGVILLDVGCGEGLDVYNLARNYSYAIGIDLSVDALKRAARGNRPANTFFIRGDAESLPLRNESISISLCLDVLEHLPKPTSSYESSICNTIDKTTLA